MINEVLNKPREVSAAPFPFLMQCKSRLMQNFFYLFVNSFFRKLSGKFINVIINNTTKNNKTKLFNSR